MIIWIAKTNNSWSQDKLIGLQLKLFLLTSTSDVANLIERNDGSNKRIVKWYTEKDRKAHFRGYQLWIVAKEVGYFQSAVSKVWCKFKRNGVVKREKKKHIGRPWKKWKCKGKRNSKQNTSRTFTIK